MKLKKKRNINNFIIEIIMATKIGEYTITTKEHSCLARTFAKGTRVKVTDCDDIRGYTIENSKGEIISEIGWEI